MDKEVPDPLFWTSPAATAEGLELERPKGLQLFALLGIFSVLSVMTLAALVLPVLSSGTCKPGPMSTFVVDSCAHQKSP